jgi:hypothetical protein
MPEVMITVPAEYVPTLRDNVAFGREIVKDGSGDLAESEWFGASQSELDGLIAQLPPDASGVVSAVADPSTLRGVLGACLIDAGGEVHDVCEAGAFCSLAEIEDATAKATWLAETIESVEEA